MKIQLPEEVTIFTLKPLFDEILPLVQDEAELILDLTGVKEFDGSALQMLVSIQKTRDRLEKPCRFLFSKSMEPRLQMYGVTNVLDLEVQDGE
ncbi:MAG TPA: STAS domain-containing protein [Thermotogota bacterium]|nr:STAS domain-containing protein [Thermotogota bacterium]HRW91455.1 STAS domain-containing protein [Thermotogota bacterium]